MTIKDINNLGKTRTSFLFVSDFKAENIEVIPLSELPLYDVEFKIESNYKKNLHPFSFKTTPIPFSNYQKKFNLVIDKIKSGDTYLLNLTQPTKIKTNLSLKEIFNNANAHYKLRYKDKFVCFSPEIFVQIKDNKIHTYPMKGTIDAKVKDAKSKILSDEKEMAEHIMVVDLLRNDLSIVAKKVRVDRFRYTQTIDAGDKKLIQVSSHISGDLSEDWHENLGTILNSLLPAGSISGTPKKSTLKIIDNVENYKRGFFSGVFGIYDGKSFDSGVMIRFVEKTKDGFIYKSGGGITLDSDVNSEYNELQEKIYLP